MLKLALWQYLRARGGFYWPILKFMSEVSLEGTGDTPYNFLTPYITPYKIYLPYQVNMHKPLKLLAVTHFVL